MLEKIMKLIYSLTGKEEGIFYINGAETLPVPLDPEEECEILERLEKESSLRSVLVERNLRLEIGRAHV